MLKPRTLLRLTMKPMQTDSYRLTPAERQRRLTQGLCLYCGSSGHMILACPLRPPRPMVSCIKPFPIKMNPLTTTAQLTAANVTLPITVLLNSGSAGNFISRDLCRQLHLSTTTTETLYQVVTITGKPLNRQHLRHIVGPVQLTLRLLHQESICFLVLEGSTADIILGHPLADAAQPNPFPTGQILQWGDECFPECFPNHPVPPEKTPFRLTPLLLRVP